MEVYSAGAWIGVPCRMLRMTQRSSTHLAVSGKISETSMPDRPCLANLYGDAKRPLSGERAMRGTSLAMLSGTSLPSSFCSSGLGSQVSTCEGPPPMNRKMTRFAFPSSFWPTSVPSATSSATSRPSSASSAVSARVPKPRQERRSTSRRESTGGPKLPQDWRVMGSLPTHGLRLVGLPSLDVDELVDAQHRLAEEHQRGRRCPQARAERG